MHCVKQIKALVAKIIYITSDCLGKEKQISIMWIMTHGVALFWVRHKYRSIAKVVYCSRKDKEDILLTAENMLVFPTDVKIREGGGDGGGRGSRTSLPTHKWCHGLAFWELENPLYS